jgi:hypothetical protein
MRRHVAILAILSTVLTLAPAGRAAAADVPQAVVDLAHRTGPVQHGGNGALYGLSDPGVPSDNILRPLKISSISQKAPDGLQHPNGDALVVADGFLRSGGDYILIETQDIYANWPFEDLGIADYLAKVEVIARKVAASEHADKFVYILFNEPDWIWYGLNTSDAAKYPANRDRFLADWSAVYHKIKSIHPTARVAGPAEAYYDSRFLPDFLRYGRDNGVLPDFLLWHELPTNQLTRYRANYAAYRELERSLGIDPIPVNINEFAGRRDLSVPGHLVQWVSMFEDTKVDAGGMAYWDAAGNLAGTASQANRPTGAWWMYKMYADTTGQTVSFTPPAYNVVDSLQGLASVDDSRRQAHVLFGGGSGDADIVIRNVDPKMFGPKVRVTLSRTDWSGYDADAPPPMVLSVSDLVVRNGTVTVPVRDRDSMSAYEIVLSPGGAGSVPPVHLPWRASYEAESATLTNATAYQQGTPENFNGYAASGGWDVGGINQPDSAVTFDVDVPATGGYKLSVLYGNQAAEPSQQVLRIDGQPPRFVEYPVTMNWQYRSRKDIEVHLAAGAHQVTLAKSDPELGTARGEAGVDRIDLERLSPVAPAQRYEAELAQPTGDVRYAYDQAGGHVRARGDGVVSFVVSVPSDGFYDVTTRHDGRGTLAVDDIPVTAVSSRGWQSTTERIFLSAGVHRVGVTPARGASVRLDVLTVRAAVHGPKPVQTVEAEAPWNQLAGGARREPNAYASGGAQVVEAGTLTLTGIRSPRGGQYVLVPRYANNDRDTGHPYNTDIISRAVDVSVNGGPAERTWLRNTWSWNNFWTVGIPITLKPGTNSITLSGAAGGVAANLDRFDIAPLVAAG